MTDLHEAPSVKAELERKATDMLLSTLHAVERGRVSAELAVDRARTIWGLVAGLVDDEVTNMAERTANEIPARLDARSIHLWHSKTGCVARIKYAHATPDFTVTSYRPGHGDQQQLVAAEPGEDRDHKIKYVIQQLVRSGHQLI